MITTRADWNDGQRLPTWWRRTEVNYPATKTVSPKRLTTHTSSAKAAKDTIRTVRELSRSSAAGNAKTTS